VAYNRTLTRCQAPFTVTTKINVFWDVTMADTYKCTDVSEELNISEMPEHVY
jgi:hypothetical protein